MRDATARRSWLHVQGWDGACALVGQPHGALVVDAAAPTALRAQADGLVSCDASIALGVFGADCPGVGIVAADALGLAHCGWRGTAQGIIANLVAAMLRTSRQDPAHWQAFIGPGISGASYEVDEAVIGARAWPDGALSPGRPGHAHLDLGSALAHDLGCARITRISRSPVCTFADDRLHSYRRQGAGQVQMLALWRAASH